jgi:hypothetical protein
MGPPLGVQRRGEAWPSLFPVQSRTLIFTRGHRRQFLSGRYTARPFLFNHLSLSVDGDEIAKELPSATRAVSGCSLLGNSRLGVSILGVPGPDRRFNPTGSRRSRSEGS